MKVYIDCICMLLICLMQTCQMLIRSVDILRDYWWIITALYRSQVRFLKPCSSYCVHVFIIGLICVYCFVYTADVQISVEEQEFELLRQFDLNTDFGPCSGITYLLTHCSCQYFRCCYFCCLDIVVFQIMYHIYSRISHPAYKPTPIPMAENEAKNSDPRISR